ncbi:MAG: PD-(D/E)XK nuclease family protein [Terracidiphilus sp.]
METTSAAEIDAWLRKGGFVITASERAARSLTVQFHRARRAEGLTAWSTPNIHDWKTFIRAAWDARALDGRMVLNPLQEQALWAGVVTKAAPDAVQLAGAADRLAALAMDAHQLLCDYASQLLQNKARAGWDRDAGAFSNWLSEFNEICREAGYLSAARLPLELADMLAQDSAERPPLLLAGFDRILPAQKKLFAAWGDQDAVRELPLGESAARIEFHTTPDPTAEIAACALWSKALLTANPEARLLVIAQDARTQRGEIERAFLRHAGAGDDRPTAANLFEFSLGVPLGQVPIVRGAQLLLRWLTGAIAENELDWLLSTDQIAASPGESRDLLAFMRALRRKGVERPQWTLAEFLRQHPRAELPAAWLARMTQALQMLQDLPSRKQTPLAWAAFLPRLLEAAGWPGARPLTSPEFQALRRWQQSVDNCASLGFDGRRIGWREFLAVLERAINETLFAPESTDAPILIAGPSESAGLTADAIWFLGASEDLWPAPGATHPLLPLAVQRMAEMPHATAKLDWELADAVTRRLLASAPEVHFSYARQSEGAEARPSRIVAQLASPPRELPPQLIASQALEPLTVAFDDATQIPYALNAVAGGAYVLTSQSRCPFQAFATARLNAQEWDAAEAGLTAPERGRLLHEVLHSIWDGPPNGIRSHAELIERSAHLEPFVESHVQRVVKEKMPARARECMPQRYLELEAIRLITLVTEWLRYEASRVPFTVSATEVDARPTIAGLTLKLRLDRVDQLRDGSLLVIDYKTGLVSPGAWELPRPDDVQLPLYANFAIEDSAENTGGLVFAQIRAGNDKKFSGRLKNAKETLMSSLSPQTNLIKKPLTNEQMRDWRDAIESLAHDFLAGRAEADPRDYPGTCEQCGLQALCRIQENPPEPEDKNGGEQEAIDA